jgi:hypothetical protein
LKGSVARAFQSNEKKKRKKKEKKKEKKWHGMAWHVDPGAGDDAL